MRGEGRGSTKARSFRAKFIIFLKHIIKGPIVTWDKITFAHRFELITAAYGPEINTLRPILTLTYIDEV